MAETTEPRRIHPVLMTALVTLPAVFVWFLFLPGYARSTRNAALVCAFAPAALWIAVGLFGAIGGP